MLVWII